jgi:hypothetical protein
MRSLLNRTRYVLVRRSTIEEYANHIEALFEFFNTWVDAGKIAVPDSLDCIVFSKDRALQLHALLSTYFDQVKDPAPLHVLDRCSNKRHRKAYNEVFDLFGPRIQSQQHDRSFKRDLLDILETLNSSKVMFLVDDILFTRPIDLHSFARLPSVKFVPSLRLGKQLSYSYWHQKPMPLPLFIPELVDGQDKLCWFWEQGEMEWGFPLSLDGHIFSRQEFMIMIKHFAFSGPNSLEGVLQRFRGIYSKRFGVCPLRSAIVNIPFNRVQCEYNYRHGNVHQDLLLEKWEQGLQMDFRRLYGMNNQSVHEEVPIEYVARPTN